MKSIWIGLFVTLLLVGHVQASEGGGGAGGTMINPYQGPWGEMFKDFDGPSENLEQALYKVKIDGKYLTEDQREMYFEALNNFWPFEKLVKEEGGLDAALAVIVTFTAGNKYERYEWIRAYTIARLSQYD